MASTVRVSTDSIRIDGGTQMRVALNEERVGAMEGCLADLPPITVYYDGSNYWLVDGFHRWHAFRRKGAKSIDCILIKGTQAEAVWAACAANADNDKAGLYRSNADKAKAVEIALSARPELSDSAIAQHVGVSHAFVAKRRELTGHGIQSTALAGSKTPLSEATEATSPTTTNRITKAGRTINVAPIAKANAERAKAKQPTPPPAPVAPVVEDDDPFADVPDPAPAKPAPAKQAWELVAEAVEQARFDLAAVATGLRKAFAVEGQELTNPAAKRYSWSGTIGAINALCRYLDDNRPIGQDAKGIVTANDAKLAKRIA
jgi:ParB-like chromosome segregation protein Spo0J